MGRRTLAVVVVLALGIFLVPVPSLPQQSSKPARVGILILVAPAVSTTLRYFRDGLRDLGYIEGQNLLLEYRAADGKIERFPQLARELVEARVDVIYTGG